MAKKDKPKKEETKLTFEFTKVKALPPTNKEIESAEVIKLADSIIQLPQGNYKLDLHGSAKKGTIYEALIDRFKNERDTVQIRRLNGDIYVIKN